MHSNWQHKALKIKLMFMLNLVLSLSVRKKNRKTEALTYGLESVQQCSVICLDGAHDITSLVGVLACTSTHKMQPEY